MLLSAHMHCPCIARIVPMQDGGRVHTQRWMECPRAVASGP
jgi:hypothetical protein